MTAMDQADKIDHFSAINDDCVFSVLDQLALDDFCAVSRTCEKFKALTEKHFGRRFPDLLSTHVEIRERYGSYEFRQTDAYVKCFSRQINSVTIDHCKLDQRLFDFIKTRCAEKIKRISFNNCIFNAESHGLFPNILNNAEVVHFRCSARELAHLMVYCTQMKRLILQRMGSLYCIPRERFSSVETVELHETWKANYAEIRHLAAFLRKNPNLKRFVFNDSNCNYTTKCVLTLITENTNIDELFICLRWRWTEYLEQYLKEFKALDDRGNFKRLDVCIWLSEQLKYVAELLSLKKMTGLHLRNMTPDDLHLSNRTAEAAINLKILSLSYCKVTAKVADLAKILQNLEELQIYFPDEMSQVKELFTSFAGHSKNLSKIVYFSCSGMIVDKGKTAPEIIEARKKLSGACKLTIYLNESTTDLDVNVKSELVDIKRVAIRYHCDIADRINPFFLHAFKEL